MYTIHAILEAYHKRLKKNVFLYWVNLLSKLTGFLLPWSLLQVLNKNGIKARIWTCRSRFFKVKLNTIKQWVTNWPVILLIGHWYKWRQFSIWKVLFLQHYLSVWGFDDEKEIFYVYDSSAQKELVKEDIPIWNIELPYNDLISCRNFWWRWLVGHKFIDVFWFENAEKEEV